MADWGVEVEGADDLRDWFDGAAEAAEEGDDVWWVGTLVEYAWYLEFGTRFMPPHTFFQPGISRVQNRIKGLNLSAGQTILARLLSPGKSVVAAIAFELEREVKVVIIEKGLIDTSNLLNSIAAGPSVEEMVKASGAGVAGGGEPSALQ